MKSPNKRTRLSEAWKMISSRVLGSRWRLFSLSAAASSPRQRASSIRTRKRAGTSECDRRLPGKAARAPLPIGSGGGERNFMQVALLLEAKMSVNVKTVIDLCLLFYFFIFFKSVRKIFICRQSGLFQCPTPTPFITPPPFSSSSLRRCHMTTAWDYLSADRPYRGGSSKGLPGS